MLLYKHHLSVDVQCREVCGCMVQGGVWVYGVGRCGVGMYGVGMSVGIYVGRSVGVECGVGRSGCTP